MDRTPGDRSFYLHNVGRSWQREEQIVWGLEQHNPAAPNGYRPATHDEGHEFSKAHPRIGHYVALGDSAAVAVGSDDRCVACVWDHCGLRILGYRCVDEGFGAMDRALFVRK